MTKINPDKRTCSQCGREGVRGYTYTIRGTYVCANKNACKLRQNQPLWRVRGTNNG